MWILDAGHCYPLDLKFAELMVPLDFSSQAAYLEEFQASFLIKPEPTVGGTVRIKWFCCTLLHH